jgi:NADPH-ferrihemoprotein reductase
MHIEFDISGSRIRYEAGDHVAVYPVNDSDIVERLGNRLGVDLGVVFTLTNLDEEATKKHPFPCPTTYRIALLHYLDVTSCPRTNVLKELSEYASNPSDKEFLLSLTHSTVESKELYQDWIVNHHRTILHVLEDLPSVNPAIDHLCELLPRLQPRYYSISSSPKISPDRIAITAILVEYETLTKRQMRGVATGWLKHKLPTESERPTVPIFVRKSQFRLPFKPTVPILMIGPGTGLAPMRSFIQDRYSVMKEGKPVGDSILYFGCRHKNEDFIYEDELIKYRDEGLLTKLHVAFSRDQAHKVYVQHLLEQNGEEVWGVLDRGGHIYVCGDARHMAHDVDQVLQRIVSKYGKMDDAAVQEYLKKLRARGRYSCDVWS